MHALLGNTLRLFDYDFQNAEFLEFSHASRVLNFSKVLVISDDDIFISDVFVWIHLDAPYNYLYKLYRLPICLSAWALQSCNLKLFPSLVRYGLLPTNRPFVEFLYDKDDVSLDDTHPIIPNSSNWGENLSVAMCFLKNTYHGNSRRDLLSNINNISDDCMMINLFDESKSDFSISELIRCIHDLFENVISLFSLYYRKSSREIINGLGFSNVLYLKNPNCYFLSGFMKTSKLSYSAFSDLRAVFSEHTGNLRLLNSKDKISTVKAFSMQYILDFESHSNLRSVSEIDKLWYSVYSDNKSKFFGFDYSPTNYAVLSGSPYIIAVSKYSLLKYGLEYILRVIDFIKNNDYSK